MISRRSALVGLGAVMSGCGRAESPPLPAAPASAAPPKPSAEAAASAEPPRPKIDIVTREISFGESDGGPQHCVLVLPRVAADRKLPLLIALHGLGESRKGVTGGAWGWVRDYWLDRAMARMFAPPLVADDFQGFVRKARLDEINHGLSAQPFRGVAVACLYTPDLLSPRSLDNARAFGRFVVEHALPRIRREPEIDPTKTGIDGVSLGGRLSLLVGLAHPTEFTSIGALQAALQLSEARELARRTKRAFDANPKLSLRLVTSERDFYKDEIGAFHDALQKASLAHQHAVLPGPHDYPWNRGPGALEMLLFHDVALA